MGYCSHPTSETLYVYIKRLARSLLHVSEYKRDVRRRFYVVELFLLVLHLANIRTIQISKHINNIIIIKYYCDSYVK